MHSNSSLNADKKQHGIGYLAGVMRSFIDCDTVFASSGPYWHLCTPGQFTELLFENDADYSFGMNSIAICAQTAGIDILAFEIMSNHLHLILSALEDLCLAFFEQLKKRLRLFYSRHDRYVNLHNFIPSVIPIADLKSLRNEIVYVNRNGFLVNPAYTPFSYPWGSGNLYFMPPFPETACRKWENITYREKERICHGRICDIPGNYLVHNGIILPQNYCATDIGMALFRDAHQYFSMVSKNYEAYSEVAKRLGESVFLTDDEMFAALRLMSRSQYGDIKPAMLDPNQKLDLARRLKSKYNASDGQIQRMLRLDRNVVAELFGH